MANVRRLDLKLGSMRKPQDFVVYPYNEEDKYVRIQSDKACGYFDRTTGEGMLCIKSNSFWAIPRLGMPYTLSEHVLNLCIEYQSKKGDTIANGFMIIG